MGRVGRLSAALSATLLLASCGQYLGDYTVEAVELATDVPLIDETSSHFGEFLAVELASETSLTALGDQVDAVYIDADVCPLRDAERLIAFGPFGGEGQDLGIPSIAPDQRPGADGRFHYAIYIPVAYRAEAATRPGQVALPSYDLRRTPGDLCLRLSAPGYHILKSRSHVITVPAGRISAALRGEPGKQEPTGEARDTAGRETQHGAAR